MKSGPPVSVLPINCNKYSLLLPQTNDKDSKWKDGLRKLISEEAVQHLDDLIFRRTTLWENPSKILEIAPLICRIFDWDDSRCSKEIRRLINRVESRNISQQF